jgi:hypothetical protein
MSPSSSLSFPPFRLDLDNQSLWRGDQETVLKAKTFALLALLVQHAGRLVTKREATSERQALRYATYAGIPGLVSLFRFTWLEALPTQSHIFQAREFRSDPVHV